METRPFDARVRRSDGAVVLDLSGEINASAATQLNAAYAEAGPGDGAPVLLNFADVDYINSTGIAVIVGILARARQEGRRILACGLTDHYTEIFRITHLSDFMTMFPDEPSALSETA
ncbi:MAG: STAS domain-containing protein [Actinomycetota bacterium]